MYSTCRLAQAAARRPKGCGRRLLRQASGGPGKPASASSAAAAGGGDPQKKAVGVKAAAVKSLGIGASAGVLGSLVGMGGGFVAIPSLTGLLRLTQHQAHGTSLGAVFATGAAGSAAYALSGHVDASSAAAMAVAGMAAAHVGARCTTGISPTSLKLALGVLMIAVSPLLPLRDKLMHLEKPQDAEEASGNNPAAAGERQEGRLSAERNEEQSPERSPESSQMTAAGVLPNPEEGAEGSVKEVFGPTSVKVARMFAIGLGSGFLAGVFGVGGGVVTVPALSLATDLSHKEVLGTSLAAMVLPALVGSATHFKQGNLIPRIALPLALGTGVGAFVGGKYAARHLDETSLKWVFSCLMVVMGARTVIAARASAAAVNAARRL